MFAIKLNQLLFLMIFHVSNCQRRIKDGEVVASHKQYVVYLLKAAASLQYYDTWLCGGALVSTEYIVTSAACVTDVMHLYAIAGYNVYVKDENINNDPCTKEKKKKIVLLCTSKAYELKYQQLEKWSFIDIAVVKVESPYDFSDESYAKICTYTPIAIPINYEVKYQEAGTDAVVFGWGHLAKWRQQGDPANYNQEQLNYAPTLLQDKEECKKHYVDYNGMAEVIDRYMICTYDKGNLNAEGETILKSPPTAQGCNMQQQKLKGYEGVSCEADNGGEEIVLIENTRRGENVSNQIHNSSDYLADYKNVIDSNVTYNKSLIDKMYNNIINSNQRHTATRRHGICQNDHGGPLVTWVGSHEVLIGVASVFKITEDFDCIGPYLFTSTQCNGAFLDCILRSDENQNEETRREICESPPSVKGYELIEKHVSWKDHPDGPADNERHTNLTTSTNVTSTTTAKSNTTTKLFKSTATDNPITPKANVTNNENKHQDNVITTNASAYNGTVYLANPSSANITAHLVNAEPLNLPNVTSKNPNMSTVITKNPYMPNVSIKNTYMPNVSTSNTYMSNVSTKNPYMPNVSTKNPYMPNVSTNNTYMPNVSTNNTYISNVSTKNPYMPNVSTNNTYMSNVSTKIPYMPNVSTNNTYMSNVSTKNPYMPNVSTNNTYMSNVSTKNPYIPNVTTKSPNSPNIIANLPNVTTKNPIMLNVTTLNSNVVVS